MLRTTKIQLGSSASNRLKDLERFVKNKNKRESKLYTVALEAQYLDFMQA